MQKDTSIVFEIQNLRVGVEGKEVLKGIDLQVKAGEVHALMGRNGSGKTTLAYTLMGHPKYEILEGKIFLEGKDITQLPPDQRARLRLFLGFQYPVAIPGLTVASFLRSSIRAVRGDEVPPKETRKLIRKELQELGIPESFMTRSLNDGFSGGEKKQLETLQLRLLDPRMAILDETDSGLDIDALKKVSFGIEKFRDPKRGILLITHYQRMLNYIHPDYVHVLMDGKIVKTGTAVLATELEEKGYDWIREQSSSEVRP